MKLALSLSLVFTAVDLAFLARSVDAQWSSGWSWGSGWGSDEGPDCGDNITVSTVLQRDLVCECSLLNKQPALTVRGSGVVLSLNGHKVSCNSTLFNPVTNGIGILVEGKGNTILGPGNVTESYGITLSGDGGHTVSRVSVFDAYRPIEVKSNSNTVDENIVERAADIGIFVIRGDRNIVTNNYIQDTGDVGISVGGGGPSSYNLIEGNLLENGSIGITMFAPGVNNRFLHNSITGFEDRGISIDGAEGSGGHEINGNEISNCKDGIVTTSVYDIRISNNHVYNTGFDGIRLDVSTSSMKNAIVTNNIITESGENGIDCSNCDNCHYIGNTISNSGGIGMIFTTNCNNALASDNVVTNNGGVGVSVQNDGADFAVLTKNTVWGNENGGGQTDIVTYGCGLILASDNVFETLSQIGC